MVIVAPFGFGSSKSDSQTSIAFTNGSFTVGFFVSSDIGDPFIGANHFSFENVIRIVFVFQELVSVSGVGSARVFDIVVHLHALVAVLLDFASEIDIVDWGAFLFWFEVAFGVMKGGKAVASVVAMGNG